MNSRPAAPARPQTIKPDSPNYHATEIHVKSVQELTETRFYAIEDSRFEIRGLGLLLMLFRAQFVCLLMLFSGLRLFCVLMLLKLFAGSAFLPAVDAFHGLAFLLFSGLGKT